MLSQGHLGEKILQVMQQPQRLDIKLPVDGAVFNRRATPRRQQTDPMVAVNSARSTRRSPRAILAAKAAEEAAAVLDGDAAAAVLKFWFEELTTDDWFRQSHALDDRIRSEFGALHQRAAAGELAGWMSRADTCLALVVILDQFSRSIYGRCTPEGCAWDPMARAAANTALARGDDRHWAPGPRRSALYLPFMHSEDLADKRRCVAMMREGLASEGRGAGGGAARGAGPGLPRLVAAQGARARPGRGTGQGPGTEPRRSAEEPEDSEGSDSEAAGSSAPWSARGPGTPGHRGGASAVAGSAGACRAHGGGPLEDLGGNYSMQGALEQVPHLPVLTLNHEHAKRFRTMKLDAQTQQEYMRSRKDVNRLVRYQCLVCAVTHEFKLSKAPATGVEQQHQHS